MGGNMSHSTPQQEQQRSPRLVRMAASNIVLPYVITDGSDDFFLGNSRWQVCLIFQG
jgi:hypothetical protein